jgi:hypothetical protein
MSDTKATVRVLLSSVVLLTLLLSGAKKAEAQHKQCDYYNFTQIPGGLRHCDVSNWQCPALCDDSACTKPKSFKVSYTSIEEMQDYLYHLDDNL